MNKCIKDLIKGLQRTEPFQDYAKLKAGMSRHDENQRKHTERIEALLIERGEAASAWWADNSEESLARVENAIEEHRKADAAWRFLAGMSGAKEAPMMTEAGADIILKCNRLLRDALAKKIKSLNDEEQKRLAAEGIDAEGREHPSITDLKVYLSKLAESIVHLEDRADNSTTLQWRHHSQLFDL